MEGTIIIENNVIGGVWFIAWLFTIGFLRLSFWKGFLAIILWPYYLGQVTRKEIKKD